MCFWFFVRCRFLCNSLVLELTRARSFVFSSLEDWHKEQLFIMNSFTYIRQFILAALLWMETFDRRQERKQAKECPICNKFITANLSNYNECINFLRRFWVFQKYKVFVFFGEENNRRIKRFLQMKNWKKKIIIERQMNRWTQLNLCYVTIILFAFRLSTYTRAYHLWTHALSRRPGNTFRVWTKKREWSCRSVCLFRFCLLFIRFIASAKSQLNGCAAN